MANPTDEPIKGPSSTGWDVASLVAALGGAVDADPLDLLKCNPEFASRAWLEAHGVPFHFWCY